MKRTSPSGSDDRRSHREPRPGPDDHARPPGAQESAHLRALRSSCATASTACATTRRSASSCSTGAGGNFCSGGDVHDIIGPLTRSTPAQLLEFTQMTGDLVKAMRACPQPIVAAVDGVCAGAGAILAMASDLRLGTERSRVAFLFVRVGLAGCRHGRVRDAAAHRRVSAARPSCSTRVAPCRARRRTQWGFYNELCSPEELRAARAGPRARARRRPDAARTR